VIKLRCERKDNSVPGNFLTIYDIEIDFNVRPKLPKPALTGIDYNDYKQCGLLACDRTEKNCVS